ncbi:MAG: pyridoxamine 5'-phosphate oxidase family protein, partial [Deltaproteobacteria bacterium]|nr:pyridoxamine 5'-phosphate oxidase family protein [Deltaproteobacteria bacterium]
MEPRHSFSQDEMKAFEPAEKIGIIACADPEGLPHVTLITSIMAPKPEQLTLGQFCEGLSKEYIQQNPQVAFLILTMDKKMWLGRARWTHLRREGPEFEQYNDIPMFRYNTYFGINTVHYLDLIEVSGPEGLPMSRVVPAALITKLSKWAFRTGAGDRILKPFAEGLFNQLGSLKFMAYMGTDGFPVIVPVIQCQAACSRRLAFSPLAYGNELDAIPKGAPVAVFCLTMSMEDVLVRGTFTGFSRRGIFKLGAVDIDWVYNSMPPAHGQIYPEV